MDDKQQSRWIPSSEGWCDCIRLQLERSDLIEIVLFLARPRLLQKHVDEFVNDSSFWGLPHVETLQEKNSKAMTEKIWFVVMTFVAYITHARTDFEMLIVLWFVH